MYEEVSNGDFTFPLFTNDYNSREFLGAIGVLGIPSIFHPSDMEMDVRFDLVAEWRNPNTMLETHQNDAIFSAIFDWMENKGHKIKHHFISRIAPTLISLPGLKAIYKSYINQNVPREFLKTFMTFRYLQKHLRRKLKKMDRRSLRKTELPLSYKEKLEFLEKFRLEKHEEQLEFMRFKEEERKHPFSNDPDRYEPSQPYLYRLLSPYDD